MSGVLEDVGDARRSMGEHGGERWRLPSSRQAAARELVALGRVGIGGFVGWGKDAEGLWLDRAPIEGKLAGLLGAHEERPVPWRGAVELVASLARICAASEARGLFPGPISPGSVVIEPETWLLADPIVRARVGAQGEGEGVSALRREWLTPAAAAGVAEDHGSNRWLLGLLLYRLLAGRGPFAGLGLRSAIDRLSQGVPPLPEAIARELPPGLQGLILRILAPEPGRRPGTAAAIVEELDAFLRRAGDSSGAAASADGGLPPTDRTLLFVPSRQDSAPAPPKAARWEPASPKTKGDAKLPVEPPESSSPPSSPPRQRGPAASPSPVSPPTRDSWRGTARRAALALSILGLGTAAGLGMLELVSDPPEAARVNDEDRPVRVGSRAPLDLAHTSPEDCASCHPRQTAEWKRSVMGHSAKSPLFQGLEILIEEQVGRSDLCPGGAGILRRGEPSTACLDPNTGIEITGSGGALWCVNCHTPRENLAALDKRLPAWEGRSTSAATRRPLRDLQPASTTEGIDCGFCHQVHGPVQPGNERRNRYEGNPSWLSTVTGQVFSMRPEDRLGLAGIANSGYLLDPAELLAGVGRREDQLVRGGVHRRPSDEARAYLHSSEFCGACHDVRLFGSDAVSTPRTGEHFRRLRNAYSEWADWAALERRAGREPAGCQDCHMSSFPGVCVAGAPPPPVAGETDITALRRGCPPGTHFESRAPGEQPQLRVAAGSAEPRAVTTHYFSGVDIPLTPEFDDNFIDQPELDAAGIPLGGEQRRDLLLGRSFRFELEPGRVRGRTLELPVVIENTGAGHKIPAGFSQEREFWVHLRITDARGRLVYEVGRVDSGAEDLRDKIFTRVNVDDRIRDRLGQPQGMFGADVVDGPDVPQWRALDARDELEPATQFRGLGLINLQNGFLRCVQCIGFIDGAGRCQPANDFQRTHRAARFADAEFDIDTGECISNLEGAEALFETYFPVGSLDATRGAVKGPDAIIDVRSAPPNVPLRWTYELPLAAGLEGPLQVEARLLFRAFPPFLIKAFADYEALQAAAGLRPSGALVTREMLDKLEVVEIAAAEAQLELP